MRTATQTRGALYTVNFNKVSGKPARILFRMPHLGCDPTEMDFHFGSERAAARQVIYTFADEGEALFSDLEQAALACVAELRLIMAAIGAQNMPLQISYSGRISSYHRGLGLRLDPSKTVPSLRDSLLEGADHPELRYSGFINSVALIVLVMRIAQLKGLIAEELGLESQASTEAILQQIETHVSQGTAATTTAKRSGAFAGSAATRTEAIRKVRAQHLAAKIFQEVPLLPLGVLFSVCTASNENPGAGKEEVGIPKTLTALLKALKDLLGGYSTEAKTLLQKFPAAIQPGADLSNVWTDFVSQLILDNENGLMATLAHLADRNRRPRQAALQSVAELFTKQCAQPDSWRQCAGRLKQFDENDCVGAINCVRGMACLLASLQKVDMAALPANTVKQIVTSITQRIGYHYRQVSGDFSDEYGADIYYRGIYESMGEQLLALLAAAPAAV